MQKEVTQSINLNDPLLLGNLLGPNDENLRFIQDSFQARITVRGSQIEIEGSPIEVDSITTLISDMLADIDQGVEPDVESISARSRSFTKEYALKSFMMMWSFPIKDA